MIKYVYKANIWSVKIIRQLAVQKIIELRIAPN